MKTELLARLDSLISRVRPNSEAAPWVVAELKQLREAALAAQPAVAEGMVVREIAKDGLPDMDKLTGRVAFIFDGCIVSGWPLDPEGDETPWEADSDVGRHGKFYGVTHWVEFARPVWGMEIAAQQENGNG